MTLKEFNKLVWNVCKFSAIAAFVLMDFTHSFPPHTWAWFFDQVFGWGLLLWFVLEFVANFTIRN